MNIIKIIFFIHEFYKRYLIGIIKKKIVTYFIERGNLHLMSIILFSFIHRSSSGAAGLTYVEVGGTFLIRKTKDDSEVNVGRWVPKHPSGKVPVYSPVYDRHMLSFDVFMVATRDIKKGEEIVRHESMWDM